MKRKAAEKRYLKPGDVVIDKYDNDTLGKVTGIGDDKRGRTTVSVKWLNGEVNAKLATVVGQDVDLALDRVDDLRRELVSLEAKIGEASLI